MAKTTAAASKTDAKPAMKTPQRVTFHGFTEDGTEFSARVKPMHFGEALDHEDATNEYWQGFVAGWIALGRPGEGFKAWAETVDAMRLDGYEIPPTSASVASGS